MHLNRLLSRRQRADFKRASEAGARGDHAAAEHVYEELWRSSGSSYFRVRAIESRRLRGARDADLADLTELAVGDVVDSLSAEHAVQLLALKMALDGYSVDELPVELRDSPAILDGAGKFWERRGYLPAAMPNAADLVALPKAGLAVERDGLIHDARPLDLPVLPILHRDVPLSKAADQPHTLVRLAGGWVELVNVYGACESTSFVGAGVVHVDEYRAEFPLEADPRSDPLIFGVTDTEVLALGPAALDGLATSRGLEGFWLAGRFAGEWGHWITRQITGLQYLRHHPLWGQLPIYVRSGLPAAFLELVDYLAPGIPRIELDAGEIMHFDRVVTSPSRMFGPPNPRAALTGTPHHSFAEPEQLGSLCRDLRGLASSSMTKWPRRALVSRQGYARRHMVNRTELSSMLARRGFVELHLGQMTAADQVSAWLQADTIVGEAGSWVFFGGLSPDHQMVVVNSDWMDQWYADLGALNAIRNSHIDIVTGAQCDRNTNFMAEGAAHQPWTLSSAGLEAVRGAVGEAC